MAIVTDPTLLEQLEGNSSQDMLAVHFGNGAARAKKIIDAESSGDPTAVNKNTNGTVDRGLFQINSIHTPELKRQGIIRQESDLFDPDVNVQAASFLYRRDGWQPWKASQPKWGKGEASIKTVDDPTILAQLEGETVTPVTDAGILKQLEGIASKKLPGQGIISEEEAARRMKGVTWVERQKTPEPTRNLQEFMNTPPTKPGSIKEFIATTGPESAVRTALGTVKFPVDLVMMGLENLKKPITEKSTKAAEDVLTGMADMIISPTGLMGWEKAKTAWTSMPVESFTAVVLPLVAASPKAMTAFKQFRKAPSEVTWNHLRAAVDIGKEQWEGVKPPTRETVFDQATTEAMQKPVGPEPIPQRPVTDSLVLSELEKPTVDSTTTVEAPQRPVEPTLRVEPTNGAGAGVKESVIQDRVYHGTTLEFDPNMTEKLGKTWVTTSPEYASLYADAPEGGHIVPMYADIRRPFDFGFRDSETLVKIDDMNGRVIRGVLDAYEKGYIDADKGKQIIAELKQATKKYEGEYRKVFEWWNEALPLEDAIKKSGYDGLMAREGKNADQTTYAVFSKSQLKSAFDAGIKEAEKPVIETIPEEPTYIPTGNPFWDHANALKTFDEKMDWMGNEAARWSTGRDFAEAIGEGKGGKKVQAWIDIFGDQGGIATARQFWEQNHRFKRRAVYEADPEFIKEETFNALDKNVADDIIGIKEDLYEQGYTNKQVSDLIGRFEKARQSENGPRTFEEVKAGFDQEVRSAQKPTSTSSELFDTSKTFSLSGDQRTIQATFKPTEVKGERMFDVERQGVDQLYDRLKRKPSVISGTLPEKSLETGAVTIEGKPLKGAWKTFKEFWSPTSTMPEGQQYLKARYKALGDIDRVESIVGKVWGKTKNLDPAIKQDLFSFLDGQIEVEQLPESVQLLGKQLRNLNNQIGEMLVKRGLLDEKVFEANKGQYVRYLYLKHILGDESPIKGMSGKMDLSYLKSRKDLTTEQRRAIGLVEDVSVAEPAGISMSLTDIAKYDFFDKIAKNDQWVWTPSIVEVEGKKWGIGKLADEVELQRKIQQQAPNVPEINERLTNLETALNEAKQATGNVPDDFMQIPNSKAYGNLAGAVVRKEIAKDILPVWNGMSNISQMSRLVNAAIRTEEKAMAAFKVSKTALNVPTAARNTVSNVIQLNMSGIPVYRIPVYMEQAAQAMLKKTPDWVQAKRNGLFKTNWSEGEIREVLNTVRTMQRSGIGVWDRIGALSKYYGKIDDFFKMTKYIEQIKNGADVGTATIEAQKWGMDYSLVHPSVKLARRHIIPFASYQYKIAPLIVESLTKRPWVIGKYVALPFIMNEVAKQTLGLTESDWKKLKAQLPLFIKQSGTYAMMPWKSPEGNAQWVNLEYFFPYQNMMAIGRDAAKGNYGELVGDIGVGNPILDIYTVAKTMRGDSPPKDPYSGRDIYSKLDTPTDKAVKTATWLYEKWAPTMLTEGGAAGYTQRAISGQKDKYGRKVTPEQAAGRWLGVNIIAPTQQQAMKERSAIQKELSVSLARIMKDPTASQAKKMAARKRYVEKIKELNQQ